VIKNIAVNLVYDRWTNAQIPRIPTDEKDPKMMQQWRNGGAPWLASLVVVSIIIIIEILDIHYSQRQLGLHCTRMTRI
jgi:hypothetical protein